jgi:formylglycine-generating enzyme required for sulfatase activity
MFVRVSHSLSSLVGILLVISLPAYAQQVSNVRSEVRNGRMVITYDLEGGRGAIYDISILAKRASGEEAKPRIIAGDVADVSPGSGHTIWWEPILEGMETNGWTITVRAERNLGFHWVSVEGGTFTMGGDGTHVDELPAHSVTVRGFQMSATEVSFDQYDRFCEATGRDKPGDKGWGRGMRPVINVSWEDASAFCAWASKISGNRIRLPSEGEWEFAARGGTASTGCAYSGSNSLEVVGWFSMYSSDKTQLVGTKKANELGLYDMSGNVWEWCSDWYSSGYYAISAPDDPIGPATGVIRVMRGGAWSSIESACRVAYRAGDVPENRTIAVGFRCVKDR